MNSHPYESIPCENFQNLQRIREILRTGTYEEIKELSDKMWEIAVTEPEKEAVAFIELYAALHRNTLVREVCWKMIFGTEEEPGVIRNMATINL